MRPDVGGFEPREPAELPFAWTARRTFRREPRSAGHSYRPPVVRSARGDVRALATDAVIEIDGEVLLLERDHPPYVGRWVLPSGYVEPEETAREACVREVEGEVGLDVAVEGFVGLYDGPDRDERGNASAAFRCPPARTSQRLRARKGGR